MTNLPVSGEDRASRSRRILSAALRTPLTDTRRLCELFRSRTFKALG